MSFASLCGTMDYAIWENPLLLWGREVRDMEAIYEFRKNDLIFQINHNYHLEWPIHQHFFIEMIYPIRGSVRVQYWTEEQECRSVNLRPGELMFLFPNVPHAYPKNPADGETEFYIISFQPTINESRQKLFLTRRLDTPVLSAEELHEDVKYLLDKFFRKDIVEQPLEIIRAYFTIFLERLCAGFVLAPERSGASSPRNDGADIINYLNLHFSEAVTLDSIARNTGINKYNVSRFFTKRLQTSLSVYLNALRLNAAQNLLLNTTKDITSIMMDCGYQNQQTFNRNFKRVTGMPPSAYRAKYERASALPESVKNGVVFYEQISEKHQKIYLQGHQVYTEPIIIPGGRPSENYDSLT